MSFQSGTATLVPCVTNANTTTSLFAPAGSGGGGSVGPNPSVSSLTLGVGGTINFVNDNSWDANGIGWATDSTNTSSIVFQPTYLFDEADNESIGMGLRLYTPGGGIEGIELGVGSIYLQGSGNPPSSSSVITLDPLNPNTTYISSLRVSSINGTIPGGGSSGPDLIVSTLTVNDSGSINFSYNNGGGAIDFNFNSGNTSSFTIQQVENQFASRVHTANGALAVLEKDGGLLNSYAPIQASGFELNTQGFPGVPTAGLYYSTGGVYLYAVGGLTIDSAASVSSLTVSSINGVAPGGVSPDLLVSTLTANNQINLEQGASLFATEDLNITSGKTASGARFFFSTTLFTAEAANANSLNIFNPGGNPIAESLNLTSQVGGPTVISSGVPIRFQSPSVVVSSFTVSTINGASYPPSSSLYPFVSTIKPGGGGVQTQYFTSTGGLAQVLTSFSTQVGHNYMLSIPFNISTFNTPSYGDALQFATQGAGATDYAYTLPLLQNGAYNFPISFKNKVGDGGVAVVLEANTAYPVEVNLGDADGAELIDLGPSA